MAEQVKITLKKSSIGYGKDQKATLRALGLNKLQSSVLKENNAAIRGMVAKVQHLVEVEEV